MLIKDIFSHNECHRSMKEYHLPSVVWPRIDDILYEFIIQDRNKYLKKFVCFQSQSEEKWKLLINQMNVDG